MPSHSLTINKDSPQHKRLVRKISSRIKMAEKAWSDRHDKWTTAEETAIAYVPEGEADALRRNRRSLGNLSYTTIRIPYSYAVMMSAHTYWASVFFARSPVHQYSGRHGEGEDQVQALEALINYQVEVGRAMGPYYLWLYDTAKYGVGILGTYWDVQKIHYGEIVEMPDEAGKATLYQATHEVEGYRGNRCYNVSPFDWLSDPRVPLTQFQDGEFCTVRRRISWNDIVRRKDAGYYINTEFLKEHQSDKNRELGSSQVKRPESSIIDFELEDWEESAEGMGKEKKHPSMVVGFEFYVDLIPNEWGLGTSTYPQKWCFTITEDLELIFGATPLGYMHGQFPFDVIESELEAYGLANRGIPEILEPVQNTMDWLINSHFYNVRASLNNQFIVDPSKLVIKDVENAGPGFLWRLRPEAFGSDLRSMFLQVPVQDVTRANIGDIQFMQGIGERVTGVNDQIMGALGGSNRKTATEVRTSTGFGVNRQKTITEYISATGFSSHSQKLVQSSQQYYDVSAKMKIVGDLSMAAGPNFLEVTPEAISGFYNFVPVDGTLPVDRLAQANLWKEMLGSLRFMPPQVMAEYDWSRIFGWIASLAGLKNIHQFKVEVMPDQQLLGQAAAGNVIPMPSRGSAVTPGQSSSTQTGLNAMIPSGDDL